MKIQTVKLSILALDCEFTKWLKLTIDSYYHSYSFGINLFTVRSTTVWSFANLNWHIVGKATKNQFEFPLLF